MYMLQGILQLALPSSSVDYHLLQSFAFKKTLPKSPSQILSISLFDPLHPLSNIFKDSTMTSHPSSRIAVSSFHLKRFLSAPVKLTPTQSNFHCPFAEYEVPQIGIDSPYTSFSARWLTLQNLWAMCCRCFSSLHIFCNSSTRHRKE